MSLSQYLRIIRTTVSCLVIASYPNTVGAQENIQNKTLNDENLVLQNGSGITSFTREFNDLKNAKRVDLFFEFPHVEHYAGLDETQLQRLGCWFSSNDEEKISNIVTAIKDARPEKVKIDEGEDYSHIAIDVREEVIFTTKNGAKRKFLFSEPFTSTQNLVAYFDLEKIVVNPKIVAALYRWGANAGYVTADAKGMPGSQEFNDSNVNTNRNSELEKGCIEFVKSSLKKQF